MRVPENGSYVTWRELTLIVERIEGSVERLEKVVVQVENRQQAPAKFAGKVAGGVVEKLSLAGIGGLAGWLASRLGGSQ